MIKRIFFNTLFILILTLPGFSQFTHVGLNAAFATQVKEPGFGLSAIYRVNDQIKLVPNAVYFLPHKITTDYGTQKFEWWAINLDGNYVILSEGIFEGYGIMGLNFMNVTGEQDEILLGTPFKDKRSLLKLGLNIGAGIRLNLGDKVVPFGELRYTLGSKADFNFNHVSTSKVGIFAGILIRISEDREQSETEDF